MLKVLLDTNILLDYMVPDRPCSDSASAIMEAAGAGEIDIVVSAGSLKDIYYIARKHYPDQLVRNYLTAFLDLMKVGSVDRAVCVSALASDEPDFEDGIVRIVAESADVDFVVTRDRGAFSRSSVRQIDPMSFANLLRR